MQFFLFPSKKGYIQQERRSEEKDAPSDEDGEVSLSEGEKEERVGN